MTSKPYQFSHVRLFHLAAFFRDHGWKVPAELRFDPATKVWLGKRADGWIVLGLGDVVPILQGEWVAWWQSLPALEATGVNNVVKNKPLGVYEAAYGDLTLGDGVTVAHAIRNGVRGLLKRAKELRSGLKGKMFGKLYGSQKISMPLEEEALWQRVNAVLTALKPKTGTGIPADAAIDALFPHEGKKKWFGVAGFQHHDSNPKAMADIFGKKKAAEMKAAEDAAIFKQGSSPANANFLIQAKATADAELIKLVEPSGKALKFLELDYSQFEKKLMDELMKFPSGVKVETLQSEENGVAKLKVTMNTELPFETKKYVEQLLGNIKTMTTNMAKASMKEFKQATKHLSVQAELAAIMVQMKANGASLDMGLLKKSIKKFGWDKVCASLDDVLNGKEAASPYTSVTYKKDSPLLGKPAWDEEPKDAPAKYYEDKDPDAGED